MSLTYEIFILNDASTTTMKPGQSLAIYFEHFPLPKMHSLQIGGNLSDFLQYLNKQLLQVDGSMRQAEAYFRIDAICIN